MPEKETMKRARKDAVEGKVPSTQAGEFVREEIEHVREGKHGARSTKQAIAIGLSKARRAGVQLPAPRNQSTSTRRKAEQDTEAAGKETKPSPKRSRATRAALKREGHASASTQALARQAKSAASARSSKSRSNAAKKAAKTRARCKGSKWGSAAHALHPLIPTCCRSDPS